MKRIVAVDENGYRIGESHPRARLTDEQVDWLRELYEEGFVGYGVLARAVKWMWGVEMTKHTVGRLCRYERRNATMMGSKVVGVDMSH